MAKQKEPIEREAYRRKCRHYSYGQCCARMRRFDKKAGLTGEFDIKY